MRSTRLCVVTLSAAALLAPAAGAQAWDPFPHLSPGQQTAIKPSLDGPAYDDLRQCLRTMNSTVGARYYAAVVEVSDPGGSRSPDRYDTVPYVDALYQTWSAGGHLDPADHVLMAMSLANRGIAIHPGSRWVELGLTGDEITRTIDASQFAEYARAGNFGRALCNLAAAVDLRLTQLASDEPEDTPPEDAAQPALPEPGPAPSGRSWRGVWLTAAVLGLLVLQVFRRRWAKGRVEAELARWQEGLARATERTLALARQHPLYFAAGSRRFVGATHELDQRSADAVNHVFLLQSEAQNLYRRAKLLVEEAGRFSVAPYRQAWRLLHDTPIHFDTGEAEERRRIFLPLTREYSATAVELLADLDRTYGEAAALVEEISAAEKRAERLSAESGAAGAAALAACQARRDLGLPTEHLAAALEPLLQRRRAAAGMATTDPLTAAEICRELLSALAEVSRRARLGNAVVEEVRGPLSRRGQQLRHKVSELRAAGFSLDEPGFSPDRLLDHGAGEADVIEDLVAAGKEAEAQQCAAALAADLEELGRQLQATEAARDGVVAALEDLERRREGVIRRLPSARQTLDRLAAEHAAETFRREADNLEELATVLERLAEWCEHIRQDHRQQRYLSALSDLECCEDLLADGDRLLREIGDIDERLAETRRSARRHLARCRRVMEELGTAASERGVGDALRREVEECRRAAGETLAAAAGPRPDWLALEGSLARLVGDLEAVGTRLRQEQAHYEASRRLADELGTRFDRLAAEVAREPRERRHVGRAVAEVRGQLQAWHRELDEDHLAGAELLRRGREVASALEYAGEIWGTEMDFIQRVEAQVAAGDERYRRVLATDYGSGVAADLRDACRVLQAARQAEEERDWEEALSLAQRGSQLIESENTRARRRAGEIEEERLRRLRQARDEAERQRRPAAKTVSRGTSGGDDSPPSTPRSDDVVPPVRGLSFSSSRSSYGSIRRSPADSSPSGGSRW